MKDHAEVHGLECTKENTIKFMQSIADMPNRPNVKWFDNGTYQGQTERGYDSVNLYDHETQVISVFRKQENGEYLFSTTCKVTPRERDYFLQSNGNFVTEKNLLNPEVLTILKNLTNTEK